MERGAEKGQRLRNFFPFYAHFHTQPPRVYLHIQTHTHKHKQENMRMFGVNFNHNRAIFGLLKASTIDRCLEIMTVVLVSFHDHHQPLHLEITVPVGWVLNTNN